MGQIFANFGISTKNPYVSIRILCANLCQQKAPRLFQTPPSSELALEEGQDSARSGAGAFTRRCSGCSNTSALGKGKQFKKATKKKQVTQSVLLLCFTCLCLWLSAALMISFLCMSSEFWRVHQFWKLASTRMMILWLHVEKTCVRYRIIDERWYLSYIYIYDIHLSPFRNVYIPPVVSYSL